MPKIIVTPITNPGLAPPLTLPEDAASTTWPDGVASGVALDDVIDDLTDYAAAFRVGAEGTFW